MEIFIISVFVLGYIFITLEHIVSVDKASTALVTGVVCWALIALGMNIPDFKYQLHEHVGHISEILFFLLGAMTIVELVDNHKGFKIITDRITTNRRVKLLWILSIVAFFFSAVLDNLTAAIVMGALLSKIMKEKNDLWFFGGMIIIAANAGGAWSPIGDVTTIMLWIKGKVTAVNIIQSTIIPSIICMVVPLLYASLKLKGNVLMNDIKIENDEVTSLNERNFIFFLGVLGLLFVPIFKLITDLPPYMGMLLSLGVIWIVTEILHRNKIYETRKKLTVIGAIKKIDIPTIFFFLGILLAVHGLQTIGTLDNVASYLKSTFNGDIFIINFIIGLLSAVVDNVPLVAGAIEMYPKEITDSSFWEFLAYCAGTGGSVLIIGSAAGVAIMGILKIDFFWYLRRITFLAFIGYASGALSYWAINKNENDTKLKSSTIEKKLNKDNLFVCKF
ncbi:MAG: sodium:proton antiporter NhaD [Bacteroidota bacterium]|nr:sodium:proton antiporter NhaD [Bacteroidota bacterium]